MLAKRIVEDPVESYQGYQRRHASIYKSHRSRRKLSIHARFVAQALDVFGGARIIENRAGSSVPSSSISGEMTK